MGTYIGAFCSTGLRLSPRGEEEFFFFHSSKMNDEKKEFREKGLQGMAQELSERFGLFGKQ